MDNQHGQPTYPGLKFTLCPSTSTVCLVWKLCNNSHPLKTHWQTQKTPKPHVCVLVGFPAVKSSRRKTWRHTQAHTLIEISFCKMSRMQKLMTHRTPTHLCHNPEQLSYQRKMLSAELTSPPVSMVPVFTVQQKTHTSLSFSRLILTLEVQLHTSNLVTNPSLFPAVQHNSNPVLPTSSNPNPVVP